MKKLIMGIVAALGIATPAMANDLDNYALDTLSTYSQYSGLERIGQIQWTYTGTSDGLTFKIHGVVGGVANISCNHTTPAEIDALTLEDHARLLNGVSARDWWFDRDDATDSWNYWRDRTNARMNNASTGLAGLVDMISQGEDWEYMGRACYAQFMGERNNGIDDEITIPGSTYNQRVHALVAAGGQY